MATASTRSASLHIILTNAPYPIISLPPDHSSVDCCVKKYLSNDSGNSFLPDKSIINRTTNSETFAIKPKTLLLYLSSTLLVFLLVCRHHRSERQPRRNLELPFLH